MERTSVEPSALHISKKTSQPNIQRSSGMSTASTEGAIPAEREGNIISTGGSSSTDQLPTAITAPTSSITPPTGSSASSESQMLGFGMNDGMSSGPGGFAAGAADARAGGSSRRALSSGVSARQSQDAFQEQQTGGEVAAGEESIEAATAKLRLSDGDSDGEQWQSGSPRGERESQPKFGLKILVPGLTAGCLIGKGGRIINQLQTTTGTRVKLSQKNEFFPGTNDRVALVQGEQPAMVGEAVAEMVRRLKEAGRQHPHSPPPMHLGGHYNPYGLHMGAGFMGGGMDPRNAPVTVRLLVPLAAGGLIIGKGGETIKAIGARTGARVILAGKDADVAGVPSERLCSIQGDLEGAIKVVLMIVGKMAEDRGLSKYQSNQTCYQTGIVGMVSDVVPQPTNISVSSPVLTQTHWGRPNRPISGGEVGAFQGGMTNGMSSPSASGGCASAQQQSSQQQQTPQHHQQQMALAASSHVPGMVPGGMLYGFPFQFASAMQGHRPFGDAYSPGNLTALSSMYPYANEIPFTVPPGAHQGSLPEVVMEGGEMITQVQVAVPDQMVGVILGKGGSTVIDMQNITGARIQVSQRGDYIPGTHNRAVTISGTPQAVGCAQMMLHNVCVQAAQYDYRQGMHQQQLQQLQQQQQQTPNQHHHQQQAPFF